MKRNSTTFAFATIVLLFSCLTVGATDYNLSSGAIEITSPGSHTITGSGSGPITLTNNTVDGVYNITLNNVTLTSANWGSAINLNNSSAGGMTVNFNIIGTNSTTGYNHGGIQSVYGAVQVLFTTSSSGTLTSNATYSDSFGFRNNGGTMSPSIDPTVTCTATLEGVTTEAAAALTGAFTKKPLVLSLSKTTTAMANYKNASAVKICQTTDGIMLEGLQMGETIEVVDVVGKCIVRKIAQSSCESVNLSKGVYLLRTSSTKQKFLK